MSTPIFTQLVREFAAKARTSDPRHAALGDTQSWVPDWDDVTPPVHSRDERRVS